MSRSWKKHPGEGRGHQRAVSDVVTLSSPVCSFLFEVQLHSAVNKMNVENLATVMGINLLKPQIEDPFTVMKGGGAHKHTGTSVFASEN